MTITQTQTFNRDDIRRVYASLAAEYKIVAEWTKLHGSTFVAQTIEQIKALLEEQYVSKVHLQLKSATGVIREAAVYRVSTDAAGWSSDRPGDLYWKHYEGDTLNLIVAFSDAWWALSEDKRRAFAAVHMPGWGTSDFDGNYGSMSSIADRHFVSGAYGMERTRHSA